jgi:hypothetical protein
MDVSKVCWSHLPYGYAVRNNCQRPWGSLHPYASVAPCGTLMPLGPAGLSPMLRTCSRVIALTAMVTCGLVTAQAADTTLTLACQGTTTGGTEDAKPEPISMGIIVNFTNRTVQGFGSPGLIDYPVKITAWNDVTVSFGGSYVSANQQLSIIGSIDRVTGDVEATNMSTNTKTNQTVYSLQYTLKCRPTQRMF